jgi:drug/metabolite transporter (DMT)-like permease
VAAQTVAFSSARSRGAAALFAATCAIALSSVLVRRSYEFGAEPGAVIVLRTGIPAVLCAVWALLISARSRRELRLQRRELLSMLALGLCLLGGATGELEALDRLLAPIAILFFALAPLWIALGARVLFRAALSRRVVVAISLSLTGVVVVVGAPTGHVSLVGAAFAMGGSLCGSGSFLLLDRNLRRVPADLIWAWALTEAALLALLLHPGALESDLGHGYDRALLIVLAGVCAGIAQLLATVGIRAVGAVTAGISVALEPVNTAILAWAILGETLRPISVVGGLIILAGVAIALSGPRLAEPSPAWPNL